MDPSVACRRSEGPAHLLALEKEWAMWTALLPMLSTDARNGALAQVSGACWHLLTVSR